MARTLSRTGTTYLVSGSSLSHGIGTGDFTVVAWIRPDGTAGDRAIFSIGTFAPAIYQNYPSGKFGVYWGGDRGFNTTLSDSVWTHVGVRRSGTTISGWVNGTQEATTHSVATSVADTTVNVGTEASSGGSQFAGGIDLVCLWKAALTAEEMLALARGAHPLRIRPTLAFLWPVWGVHDPEIGFGSSGIAGVSLTIGATGAPKSNTNAPVELWPQPPSFLDDVAGGSPQNVEPDGIVSGSTLGAPAITVTVAPTAIPSGSSLGAPSITVGVTAVSPTSIGPGATLGALTITTGAISIAPDSTASSSTLGTPSVTFSVAPDSITAGSSLGAPTLVVGAVTVEPTSIAAGSALGEPTVSLADLTITPTSIGPTVTLGSPTIYGGILVLDNRSRYYALAYIQRLT
jgi:hypothetical protein